MANYRTPGVYIEEVVKFPPSVAQVATAIPAFVGYTETAGRNWDLKMKPKRISSLLEYEELFGQAEPEANFSINLHEVKDDEDRLIHRDVHASLDEAKKSKHNMYYALQMFYNNGGGACYIVSAGGYGDISLANLQEGLASLEKEDEITLLVFPEATNLSTDNQYYTLQQLALKQCAELKDRFAVMDIYGEDVSTFRDKIGNNNLKYGAAYHPHLVSVLNHRIDASSIKVNHTVAGGSQPAPPKTTSKKGKDAAPAAKSGSNKGEFDGKTLEQIKTINNSTYLDCIRKIREVPVTLPPSAAMVGVYAAVDSSRGVWKAPANVSLNGVSKVTIKLTNAQQENLNVDTQAGKSVNAIRPFTGKGILVWGARTLAGNDNEWRYVSVRRFFNMIEESVKKATMQFVFEPNDAGTWVRVRAMIENFLTLQWRQGALAGAKAEDAFFVKLGLGETMTALDILEGRMVIEIGMAVVRPAEFIILKFSHKMQES
ncbi:MAG: phage tail sheath family protein [Chitinophagales bacterium]